MRALQSALVAVFGVLALLGPGVPAPAQDGVSLQTVSYAELGKLVRSFTGKVVVVDFWGVYCAPCVREFPHLVELHRKYARGGLAAVSVSLEDCRDRQAQAETVKFLRQQGATFPNVILDAPFAEWQANLEIDGPPAVYVFDRDNRLVKRWPVTSAAGDETEGVDYTAVEKVVRQLLSGAPERAAGLYEQGPPPATAKRLDFAVTVAPLDPFSRANLVAAPLELCRGEVFRLTVTATPRPGFHTYPITRRAPDQEEAGLTTIRYAPGDALEPVGPLRETPEPRLVDEGAAGKLLEYAGPVTWTQDVRVKPAASPGEARFGFTVHLQVCGSSCAWGEYRFVVPLRVSAPSRVGPLAPEHRLAAGPVRPVVVPLPAEAAPEPHAARAATPAADGGLLAFVLQGIFWGAVSLVTPCVFPMIPVTVSFFLKQAEKHQRPLVLAAVYSLTIVVVLTTAATALLSFFRWLSVNPVMNLGLGVLFVVFALSLFGMFEIGLPAGLAQFTSAREGQGGLVGTMFMALTFTIISFACVAPFLGGFGGTAAGSHLTLTQRFLGGAAFSATFAAPFFLLALFPGLLKRLPQSGAWLNSVKVVMGFLELAAALKFFRAGELLLLPAPVLFTYDLVLALYVGISLLCGLYLLGLYRLPHDSPADHLGVPRMLLGLGFLALSAYLTPALFQVPGSAGQRPRPDGAVFAWVDSFLLPQESGDLPWLADLDRGLAEARSRQRLVFLNFTGMTCTNCKINEAGVLSRPEVRALLQRFVLVRLHTDKVPGGPTEAAARNLALERRQFNTEQLPLYVVVRPLGDGSFQEVARYDEGKINDETAFRHFLTASGEEATSPPPGQTAAGVVDLPGNRPLRQQSSRHKGTPTWQKRTATGSTSSPSPRTPTTWKSPAAAPWPSW
jgi:thiol:disulfide interchange protein/thiol-disulfide isomerase/thioredoxin